jgi:tRNA(Ile)-lysidine synthase
LVKSLKKLRDKKNLLAFSAGVDSTALFFILLENDIAFDIAIVDYGKREDSICEVSYAKELAKKYDKKCFHKKVNLKDSNFEKNARVERYKFFEEIINTHGYENLLTAHQLNDRLEWFLMQFTKGAGAVELLGFEEEEKRENYNLLRPLIHVSKDELLEYLKENSIKYFEDESNTNPKYKRNLFRVEYANKLIHGYKDGIKKSFEYLQIDKERLFKLNIIKKNRELYLLKKSEDEIENLRAIDKVIKKLGVIISSNQREEILRQKESVVAHKIAIAITEDKIYIAPYKTSIMDKNFKELCRELKIPPKIRGYIFDLKIDPKTIV